MVEHLAAKHVSLRSSSPVAVLLLEHVLEMFCCVLPEI